MDTEVRGHELQLLHWLACLIQSGHDQFWEPVLKDRGPSWLNVPLTSSPGRLLGLFMGNDAALAGISLDIIMG